MRTPRMPHSPTQRRSPALRLIQPRVAAVLVVLLVAGGMTGGNCAIVAPPTSGSGGTSSTSGVDDDGSIRRPAILDSDHVLGDDDATLVIVLYEDYQSQACGEFARVGFPTLQEQYVDTGKVRWVFRHFPLSSNAQAEPAARAAECADDQGQFFAYRDLIYETTDTNNATILTDDTLREHAETLELDQAQFDTCFDGDFKDSRVQLDVNSGTALGVTNVPTLFIGSERVLLPDDANTAEKLIKIIERHLDE